MVAAVRVSPLALALWALALFCPAAARELRSDGGIDAKERLALREEVREMFYHGYNSYLNAAFPHDELRPLTCTGADTFGGLALTAVDALDTLMVMGNVSEFERMTNWVVEHVSFDINQTVSLFETNIRVLGGLLSAHLMARPNQTASWSLSLRRPLLTPFG